MTGQARNPINNLFTTAVNPGNTRFSFTWKWCYTGIHRANNGIAYIPEIPMNERKKARLIAECKVIRAFFYMRLNELFGSGGVGVPVYLEPVSPAECYRGQTPESEVWATIIQDLTDAINTPELPNHQINGEGRINKGSAYAFRGRAYLITKDYDKAIADFVKVGECGYKLYNPTGTPSDYKQLFKVAQERCEEMIFSLQHIDDQPGYGSRVSRYLGAHTVGAKDNRYGWSDVRVSKAAGELYEVLVDANTVKPFNWNDFIPQWESITAIASRSVFFVRDRTVNGMEIHSQITTIINNQLNTLPSEIRTLYLPEGNEARLKTAFANRDPRLAINTITPYADYLGVNSTSSEASWYTLRWPVIGRSIFSDSPQSERILNPGLPADYYPSGCANEPRDVFYLYRKFVGEGLEYDRYWDNPIDEPLIRYADVLLMWAEALVEKNDLSGAMAKVKEVRDRVGVPTMASSFADQTTARNYVRDERRRELLGEGVNFFDEMRWRTLKETKFSAGRTHTIWGGSTIANNLWQWIGDQWYTWPVPNAEIEMNPNLKRTPGWEY